MSWRRLATYFAGAGMVVGGLVFPPAGPYLVPAGAGLLGWATRWPEDRKRLPPPDAPPATYRGGPQP